MESLSTKMERLQWRRSKVLELSSQGYSQPETAKILQVGLGTVSRDIQYIRQQARDNISKHINQRLPQEYERCLSGLNQILKISWRIAMNTYTDDKTKLQACAIANDCYKFIMDLATNGIVISDAIKYVTQKTEQIEDTLHKTDDERLEQTPEAISEKENKTTTNGVF